MLIAIHVSIAISTLVYASYLYFRPAPENFSLVYLLLGSTIASGTLLVFIANANLLKTCLTGLAYIGLVSASIAGAKYKLAKQANNL